MTISAEVICDSISPDDVRLITLQLRYPRFILAELNTHRVFSRSSASSRAIPLATRVSQVRRAPFVPQYWPANQPGMQGGEQRSNSAELEEKWRYAATFAANVAEMFSEVHKSRGNRLLEPFVYVDTVVTATEWDNFFAQRAVPKAEPEFHELAIKIKTAINSSSPDLLWPGSWHLPYVTESEKGKYNLETLRCLSAARCARVSYANHGTGKVDVDKDVELHTHLVENMHWSPLEHQATPIDTQDLSKLKDRNTSIWSGNFRSWEQYRKTVDGGPSKELRRPWA